MSNYLEVPASSISRHNRSGARSEPARTHPNPQPDPALLVNPFLSNARSLSPLRNNRRSGRRGLDNAPPLSTIRLNDVITQASAMPQPHSRTYSNEPDPEDDPEGSDNGNEEFYGDEQHGEPEAQHEENFDPDPSIESRPLPRTPTPGLSAADKEGMAHFAGQLASSFAQHMTKVVEVVANKVGAKSSGSFRSRIRDPEVFNGTEPRKLQTFLISLTLVFAERPAQFDDQQKVSYAISYLDGAAREWFEPDLILPDVLNPPAWMFSYDSFVQELFDNFGTYDAETEAEDKLATLRMKETNTVHKYLVKFNMLAAAANWDENALQWAFRQGLPSRIKDDLTRLPKPPTSLAELRKEVQRSDTRHWSREQERKRDNAHSQSSSSKPAANSQPERKPWNNSSNKPASTTLSSSTLKAPDSAPKPYADKLDKDGKLSPAERARRIAEKLCLFCGKPGHRIDQCHKRKSAEDLKARASQTASAASSSDSGK